MRIGLDFLVVFRSNLLKNTGYFQLGDRDRTDTLYKESTDASTPRFNTIRDRHLTSVPTPKKGPTGDTEAHSRWVNSAGPRPLIGALNVPPTQWGIFSFRTVKCRLLYTRTSFHPLVKGSCFILESSFLFLSPLTRHKCGVWQTVCST